MKKFKKSWKIWIIVAFISAFLLACGTLVYARSGFQMHERSYNGCANCWTHNWTTLNCCNELTIDERDLLMHKIDSLFRIDSN